MKLGLNLVLSLCWVVSEAFVPPQRLSNPAPRGLSVPQCPSSLSRSTMIPSTRLFLLLDVPDGFFTVTFPMLGILLSISKNFARVRMEENAWEQRLASARQAQLRADPTLTELDLRRQEAALEWSAYGKPRFEEEEARKRQRVKVLERRQNEHDKETDKSRRSTSSSARMSDAEIQAFELEYGIEYDPYYDEPYDEDELPTDMKYQTDRRYGDRIYENGEIFYRHDGQYFRQGAKPRNLKFWE